MLGFHFSLPYYAYKIQLSLISKIELSKSRITKTRPSMRAPIGVSVDFAKARPLQMRI
jgi:hypothetical protein